MTKKQLTPTKAPQEKAFLVGIEIYQKSQLLPTKDSLEELALLADTAGLKVIGSTFQKITSPNPATLIGLGKADEIRTNAVEQQADIVIFDDELSPRHIRELEKIFSNKIRVIDRTVLILDIFAQHAQTSEGKLQVELAQYEYLYPRLTRAWTHLARQTGGAAGRTGNAGGVGLRGPGETQLEVDRRRIRKKIDTLNDEIEKVRAHRERSRANRKKTNIPVIALVGYTNSGKSTLLNYLTQAEVIVADKLFATLDPTTRRLTLPNGNNALITDTVGFIQKLPAQLVAAFRATLEEITEADLLLHIVDISSPIALQQWQSVNQTLKQINAYEIPIVTTLNKIDKFDNLSSSENILHEFKDAIPISALEGTGVETLINKLDEELFNTYIPVTVKIPYQHGNLISIFHHNGRVNSIQYGNKEVRIKGSIPNRFARDFSSFIVK